MSRPTSIRLFSIPSSLCASCARRFLVRRPFVRSFASTRLRRAEDAADSNVAPAASMGKPLDTPQIDAQGNNPIPSPEAALKPTSRPAEQPARSNSGLGRLAASDHFNQFPPGSNHFVYGLSPTRGPDDDLSAAERVMRDTHHLHVYATKHNTHITLTRPDRNPMLSLSTGNLGFRKAQRGTFDAGFQLASYVLTTIRERGWGPQIAYSEVILRGFGRGREAATKALLGVEGQQFRSTVVRVTDYTRLKFGGTRSKKPRRLG